MDHIPVSSWFQHRMFRILCHSAPQYLCEVLEIETKSYSISVLLLTLQWVHQILTKLYYS